MVKLNKRNLRKIGAEEARLLGITDFRRGWKKRLRGRLIEQELWDRVQKRTVRRKPAPRRTLVKSNYELYLRSELWAGIRLRVLTRDNHECCVCLGLATQVHHLAYDRDTMRGRSIRRLVSMCAGCHREIEFDKDGNKRHLHMANWRLCDLLGMSILEFEATYSVRN